MSKSTRLVIDFLHFKGEKELLALAYDGYGDSLELYSREREYKIKIPFAIIKKINYKPKFYYFASQIDLSIVLRNNQSPMENMWFSKNRWGIHCIRKIIKAFKKYQKNY